jgi:hypothetical protein
MGLFFFFFFFFGCFSPLGYIHGNENHFQFIALHFKAMGVYKIYKSKKTPWVLSKGDLAIGGGTAAAMSIASERTNA